MPLDPGPAYPAPASPGSSAAGAPLAGSAPETAALHTFPEVPIRALDTLWFQVAGTVCNLSCTHCFISCSPGNVSHRMMRLLEVLPYLEEAESLGVKEYYFTGGEPFANPEMEDILSEALHRGPCTVLSNGTLIGAKRAAALKALSDASAYSLDIRLSLDGYDAATNDAIRGAGTFSRILEAVAALSAAGLDPVITVTEACDDAGSAAGRARLLEMLRSLGLARPRLKVMPLLRLGAEARRTRPYAEEESLRGESLSDADFDALQCSSGRMVTAKGVYVCPILIESPSARFGDTLASSLKPYPLSHRACHTCHAQGLSCRT